MQTLLSKVTYNKYIFRKKEKQQYISVRRVRLFIEAGLLRSQCGPRVPGVGWIRVSLPPRGDIPGHPVRHITCMVSAYV